MDLDFGRVPSSEWRGCVPSRRPDVKIASFAQAVVAELDRTKLARSVGRGFEVNSWNAKNRIRLSPVGWT